MTRYIHKLADDRILGYALFGPPSGQPVLYFHGTPSSRREVLLLKEYGVDLDRLLERFHLRLIAIDRPGMGWSEINPAGSIVTFAHDVKHLLHKLQISDCYVLGWSGGGPFALGMAFFYPTIIRSVFILCGFTKPFNAEVLREMHMNKWYFRAAKHFPWLLKSVMNVLRKKTYTQQPSQKLTGLPPVDYNLLKESRHFKALTDLTFREACCRGAEGAVYEARLYFKNFGFELSDIIQTVHYWWGTEDRNVVKLHADAARQNIRDCVLHIKPGEGHLSLFVKYFTEALETIAESVLLEEDAKGSES